jgi:hypothetical protein
MPAFEGCPHVRLVRMYTTSFIRTHAHVHMQTLTYRYHFAFARYLGTRVGMCLKHMYSCTHTHIRTYAHTHIHTYIQSNKQQSPHNKARLSTYTHTCIHTYVQTGKHAYMYTYEAHCYNTHMRSCLSIHECNTKT